MNNSQNPNNISWGLSLVTIGLIFLLDNMGILNANLYNWWAIFILMPGINMVYTAWKKSQTGEASTTSLLPGIMLVALGFSFLLDINWDFIFPIALILVGISILTKK